MSAGRSGAARRARGPALPALRLRSCGTRPRVRRGRRAGPGCLKIVALLSPGRKVRVSSSSISVSNSSAISRWSGSMRPNGETTPGSSPSVAASRSAEPNDSRFSPSVVTSLFTSTSFGSSMISTYRAVRLRLTRNRLFVRTDALVALDEGVDLRGRSCLLVFEEGERDAGGVERPGDVAAGDHVCSKTLGPAGTGSRAMTKRTVLIGSLRSTRRRCGRCTAVSRAVAGRRPPGGARRGHGSGTRSASPPPPRGRTAMASGHSRTMTAGASPAAIAQKTQSLTPSTIPARQIRRKDLPVWSSPAPRGRNLRGRLPVTLGVLLAKLLVGRCPCRPLRRTDGTGRSAGRRAP